MLAALSASAYYDDYGYSSHSELSGFELYILLLSIAGLILSIVILIRWFKMTADVKEIKETITLSNTKPKLTYLIAIGEREKADKSALIMMVDRLTPMYNNEYNYERAASMNRYIASVMPRLEKLGINLPDYVKSGEKFIDFMNGLTGKDVPYTDTEPSK